MNLIDLILKKKLGYVPEIGETVFIPVNRILLHDGSLMLVDRLFRKHNFSLLEDSSKVFVAFDHIYPANNAATANLHNLAREFVRRFQITNFFEGSGISHQLLLESKLVNPYDIVVGGDSHTPTIGAASALGIGFGATDIAYALLTSTVWFTRPKTILIYIEGVPESGLEAKDVALYLMKKFRYELHGGIIVFRSESCLMPDWKIVLCNMAPEYGAISAIFEPEDWQRERGEIFQFSGTINLSEVEAQVALPHQVSNIHAKEHLVESRTIDVVFVGTCTGGRFSDIETLANTIKDNGGKISARLIVCPASKNVYRDAMNAGYISYLLDVGATILPPSCGPCLGQSVGILGDGEVCVSTANRNFRGRMGNANSEIILASTKSAAICAVEGKI